MHEPGVITENVTEESRPTDCFIKLFSKTVLNHLVDMVNSSTEIKMQQSRHAKKKDHCTIIGNL